VHEGGEGLRREEESISAHGRKKRKIFLGSAIDERGRLLKGGTVKWQELTKVRTWEVTRAGAFKRRNSQGGS